MRGDENLLDLCGRILRRSNSLYHYRNNLVVLWQENDRLLAGTGPICLAYR